MKVHYAQLLANEADLFLAYPQVFSYQYIDTPLGAMLAVSDDSVLYLLEFIERKGLDKEIIRLKLARKASVISQHSSPIDQVSRELEDYFSGSLKVFQTSVEPLGTAFQYQVWAALKRIPYGETRSYLDLAQMVNCPRACRAVANANAANQFALIIPCHRVIRSTGELGGYAGGVDKKGWLLGFERG